MKQKWGGNLSYDLICSPANWLHVCHSLLSHTSTTSHKKKVFSVSSVQRGLRWLVAWKLKKNADWRHLSGGGYGASRLLWPHDPSIIDDVTFFHEQIQKPFASMHATAPRLAVLFAVNFIHMSKKCTIKRWLLRAQHTGGLLCASESLIVFSVNTRPPQHQTHCGQLYILMLAVMLIILFSPTLTHFGAVFFTTLTL